MDARLDFSMQKATVGTFHSTSGTNSSLSAMQRGPRTIDPELFAPGGSSVSGASKALAGTYGGFSSASNQQPLLRDAQSRSASGLQAMSIELEHVSGFTGKGKNTLHAHPRDVMSFVTWYAVVLLCQLGWRDGLLSAAGPTPAWALLSSSATCTRRTTSSCYAAMTRRSLCSQCPIMGRYWRPHNCVLRAVRCGHA